MKTSDKGIVALATHEGIVPGPYRDSVGVWTYGIGHTASAGTPDPERMPRGMPANLAAELREVFRLFRVDLRKYELDVVRALKVPVAQHEFDAAVSFHYNTGAIGRASWVQHMNNGNRQAAVRAIMNWTKPREVTARRKAERDLFQHGLYPAGKVPVWSVSPSGAVIWSPIRQLTATEVLDYMRPEPVVPNPIAPPPSHKLPTKFPPSPFAAFFALLARIFGGRA